MYEEFKIDENLLYLYTLLENLECICFDDDILYAIITLKTKVNKKLYSQFDKSSIDFNDYYFLFQIRINIYKIYISLITQYEFLNQLLFHPL